MSKDGPFALKMKRFNRQEDGWSGQQRSEQWFKELNLHAGHSQRRNKVISRRQIVKLLVWMFRVGIHYMRLSKRDPSTDPLSFWWDRRRERGMDGMVRSEDNLPEQDWGFINTAHNESSSLLFNATAPLWSFDPACLWGRCLILIGGKESNLSPARTRPKFRP